MAVWDVLRGSDRWLSTVEIARRVEGVMAPRTVRAHARRLVELRVVDCRAGGDGHHYRVVEDPDPEVLAAFGRARETRGRPEH